MPILSNIFKKTGKKDISTQKKVKQEKKTPGKPQVKKSAPQKKTSKAAKQQSVLKGSSSMKGDRALGAYQVIVRPHISEKSVAQSEKGKYVFEVFSRVNSSEVRDAVERTYGVEVGAVNMVKVPSKRKNFRRLKGESSRHNKAIVTLKKGHSIEVLPQ